MFKTIKANIIFVTVFSLICIITTAILILYQKIEIEEKSEETTVKDIYEKDVSRIELYDKYNQNDLKIEEKAVTQEKAEIRYLQISGLKNKNIENKINNNIKQLALNYYKNEIKDLNEVINIAVNMSNTANFSNTISFELSYTAKIDDDGDGFYQGVKGLNFDLNTGENITLDKIFTSDAPIEEILRKSSYYNLLSCTLEENLSGDLIISDYGNIEDEIAYIVNLYRKEKLNDFSFTPMNINIYYDDNKSFSIKMEDYLKYIAIYNIFLSKESLFESDSIGMKNIYVLTQRNNDIYYYTNYQNEDNYFIDISIDFQSFYADEFAKKIVQDKIKSIEKEIENIKQKVLQYPDNFYILNYYISVYTGEEWSTGQIITNCYEKGNAYEMTAQQFEEEIEPIIINYARQNDGGGLPDYVYNFSKYLKIEPQNMVEYYNPETGEKIVV